MGTVTPKATATKTVHTQCNLGSKNVDKTNRKQKLKKTAPDDDWLVMLTMHGWIEFASCHVYKTLTTSDKNAD